MMTKKAERYIELVRDENGWLHEQHALRAIEIAEEETMQQMMKDAKDATVIMTHVTNESLSPALSVVLLPDTFQEGDKVKVIIVPKTNSPKKGG